MQETKTENEQKKEFLMSYQLAKRDVTRLEEQLAELRVGKMSPGCEIGDGLPHAHNATDLSGYAAKVDALEREIVAARYRRICAFERVRDYIKTLENEKEQKVLFYRYLGLMKWEKIADKMQMSYRQILRIHGKALRNLHVILV